MYERLLKQTERYLENRKEVTVPVKQVWEVMVKLGKTEGFTVPSLIADFECLLEGDHRFEFVSDQNPQRSHKPDLEEFLEHDEFEKLGFVNNQKVRLRRLKGRADEGEEESFDALDRAISLEELHEDLGDTSLLDGDTAASSRDRGETATSVIRAGRTKDSVGKASKKKGGKVVSKIVKKKPSAKKGKK